MLIILLEIHLNLQSKNCKKKREQDHMLISSRNNVMGTHILLEAAKIRKITRFIHVSTDEVYGEVINGVRQKATEKKKKKLIFII